MDTFAKYVEDNKARFIAELQEILRQPTISAQNVGMAETAAMPFPSMKKHRRRRSASPPSSATSAATSL